MHTVAEKVADFLRSEDGPTATEYAVLIAVISMGVIVAMGSFGSRVGNIYTAIDATVPSGGGGS